MKLRQLFATSAIAAAAALSLPGAASAAVNLEFVGRYATGLFDQGAAEIPAYDAASKRLFVVNLADRAIDVISVADPASPVKVGAIDLTPLGQAANSVSVKNGVVAVAVEAAVKTDPGLVAFYDAASLGLISTVTVGALPDMLTWSADGTKVVVANEGEPNDDYSIDPEGSVSIINATDVTAPTVRTVGFTALNSRKADLIASGVRIKADAVVSQDLEPEYLAISPDGRQAFITLQENNAIAVINLDRARLITIRAMGTKNHAVPGEGFDPSDRDNSNAIGNWPVSGYYMPDAIAAYRTLGRLWLVTANEGDQREYSAYTDSARLKDLTLDPTVFPDAAALQGDAQLGRLTVSQVDGDTDGDGDLDRIYAYGGRSFSIWNSDNRRIFDSKDAFEQITAAQFPEFFNADHGGNARDNRSDNKGPEPEGLALATIGGRIYVFIGLERVGGIMVYDITIPSESTFVQYINTRDFTQDPESGLAGDLGPEGLLVIPATDSPTGQPMLVVSNEVSGTTALFTIRETPAAK